MGTKTLYDFESTRTVEFWFDATRFLSGRSKIPTGKQHEGQSGEAVE